jgi:hypothetical protein
MTRSMLVLGLVSALVAGCSPASEPPSGAANQSPAATAPPPAGGAPAAAPAAAPTGQNRPESAAPAGRTPAAAAPAAPVTPAATPPSAAAVTPPAAAPAAPPAPPPPPEPKFREVTIPAETMFMVTLVTPLASNKSKVEDQVKGTVAKPIIVSGTTVVPAGAELVGTVVDVKQSGRVKGRASIAIRFDRLHVRGESHRIHTAQIAVEQGASTKSDAKKGAIGAGAGAIVGGIAGGGSGAAIGGVIGGAGTVLATKGKEVELEAGTLLSTKFLEPVKVLVPIREQ